MRNVLEMLLHWIFHNDANIIFKFDVQQSCSARRAYLYAKDNF